MKYCRWTLIASNRSEFVDYVVFKKSFRTINEAIKVCTGFPENIDYVLYDNDVDDECDAVIDISDFVYSQKEFEKYNYCMR